MGMQKKLDERDFRYLQFVVGRAHGTTDEQIVKELEDPDIESPQVLHRDVHPKMEEFPAYTFVPC
jgi:hypothetical protein